MGAGQAALTTSDRGIAFLERQEGVVLRTYLDPVGQPTVGAGLTAASGVIIPKPGQEITRDEARALLIAAMGRTYEPQVRRAMPGTAQHEFDAAVSFHWNTGAIDRASWVAEWRGKKRWPVIEAMLGMWKKGGGKVLPGLVERRAEEFLLLRDGIYGASAAPLPPLATGSAGFAIALSPGVLKSIREGFRTLGYEPGRTEGVIDAAAVTRFQKDHGLTADGIIGRATLSTLQRCLDLRSKSATTAVTGAAGAAVQTGGGAETAGLPGWAGYLVLGVAVLFALRLAWTYRDVIAARVQHRLPKLAEWLRSR